MAAMKFDHLSDREKALFFAGLFEGEGCITWQNYPKPNGPSQVHGALRIKLAMTDIDVVEAFHAWINSVAPPQKGGPRQNRICAPNESARRRKNGEPVKQIFKVSLGGDRAEAVLNIFLDYDVLGARRTQKAEELLKLHRERPSLQKKLTPI